MGPVRCTFPRRMPLCAIDTLHRDVSLLVIAVLVIHVVTSVLGGFAPINFLDAVIPFRSAYRPVWMGLGAFAFEFFVGACRDQPCAAPPRLSGLESHSLACIRELAGGRAARPRQRV